MKIRSKWLVNAALSAALLLGISACNKAQDAAAETDNFLLGYVPEDTPYLAGNLAPIPEDVIESAFERAQPALDAVQDVLAGSKIRLSGSAAEENPQLAIMAAIVDELNGKLSRQGLESLGFTMEAYQTVYGMGLFPVIRLSLGSPQAFRDTIGRIEVASGIDFPELELQGQSYWRVASADLASHSNAQAGIYIAIIEESGGAHLALSIFPAEAETEYLPQFLGQSKPARSTAAGTLASVNQEYGYAAYGTGWLDFQRMFEQFVDPQSSLRRALGENASEIDEHLDAVCKAEISGLIARAPRMVVGTTELTPSAMAGQFRLELADDLASELAALVSDVPSAPAQSDRLLEFAIGIRLGAARDFLIDKATALSQQPFQCEALQGINDQASDALVKLNYPVPPLVNNFLGLRASLSEVPDRDMDIGALLGTVALYVDKPEMFVGMAQMFLPQLEEFKLVKGEPPVRLPESLMPSPEIVAYAAMSDKALGISVGQGEEAHLTRFIEARSESDGSFLSMNYDMAAYMDRIDVLGEDLRRAGVDGDTTVDGEFESGANPGDYASASEVAEAIREALKNMAGRSQLSFSFDDKGFAIDSRMTFND